MRASLISTCFFIIIQSFNICYAKVILPFNTTFDCDHDIIQTETFCDGLDWGGAWDFEDKKSEVISAANNPNGVADSKGFRQWIGDGVAVNTSPGAVVFEVPQTQLWIRWYMKYQNGFKWEKLGFDKHMYIYTAAQNYSEYTGFYGLGKYAIVAQSAPVAYPVKTEEGEGWTKILASNPNNESDGTWHCYEVYLKMDTDGTDGIGKIWINGVLKASNIAVNWSGGNTTARVGWTYFKFANNQYTPGNGTAMYADFDDIAVYNTTPPSKDSQGNPFIGPISGMQDFKSDD